MKETSFSLRKDRRVNHYDKEVGYVAATPHKRFNHPTPDSLLLVPRRLAVPLRLRVDKRLYYYDYHKTQHSCNYLHDAAFLLPLVVHNFIFSRNYFYLLWGFGVLGFWGLGFRV